MQSITDSLNTLLPRTMYHSLEPQYYVLMQSNLHFVINGRATGTVNFHQRGYQYVTYQKVFLKQLNLNSLSQQKLRLCLLSYTTKQFCRMLQIFQRDLPHPCTGQNSLQLYDGCIRLLQSTGNHLQNYKALCQKTTILKHSS